MELETRLKKIRTLIVDDSRSDRILLEARLKALGFQSITEAEDGSAGLMKINNAYKASAEFHLVFIDFSMPRKNGMELLQNIRNQKETKHLYVIMITGMSDTKNVEDAREKGVNDFIVKPFDISTLRLKVQAFAEKIGV